MKHRTEHPVVTQMRTSAALAAASAEIATQSLRGPTTEEMKRAWEEFKATNLFAVLVGHMERADKLLATEGTIWGFFYNGYIAGWNRKGVQS